MDAPCHRVGDGVRPGSRRRGTSRAPVRGAQADPQVLAWALMGVGEAIGMRWILWNEEAGTVPDDVLDEVVAFVVRGLAHRLGRE